MFVLDNETKAGRWRALKYWCSSISCPSGPSQASCHLYFDSLFYEVILRLSAVNFIFSERFRQFCLRNEAACWNFLIQSTENWSRWSCVTQHRRMSTDWSVLADQRTFHFWEVTTPISGHAYTEPVSEQSKHPNNAYVICVFKWAAQSDWEQWHKTRPDLHANGHAEHGWVSFWQANIIGCTTGHALTSMFSIYGQGGWHINSATATKRWPQVIFHDMTRILLTSDHNL